MSAEKTCSLPGLKGSRSQQSSPESSSSSSSSHHSGHTDSLQLSRQASDPGLDQTFHQQQQQSQSQHRRGSSQDSIVTQHQAALMSQTETIPVCTVTSPNYTSADLPELVSTSPHNVSILHQSRPLILQHPHGQMGSDEGINWLYDFYPSVLGGSPKDKLGSFPEQSVPHSAPNKVGFSPEPSPNTVFPSQEKYVVLVGAPISIAQRMGEDTLTYLNKGQFYNLYCKANTSMTVPERVKTLIALTFFDEPDKRVEYHHWQYWYNLQANPNQRAFDIDRKNCENIQGKPEDVAYNATSFVWCPKVGAKLVLRINCLSTEFSSQKGVKGLPLHIVTDTYEELDTDQAEPVHRAYCQVKVFRDKGAERKNKDETKSVERRMQKFMKQSPGVDSELGPASVFHPPSKETVLTSTSTFGPKPFLFVAPLLETSTANSETALSNSETTLTPSKVASTSLLASIRERETKRTFSNTLSRTKEDLDNLEVDAPAKKAARIPNRHMITLYARKEEEKVYNALILDSLSVHDLKLQVSKKYDVPADMIKNVFKKTKKGLLVHFDDEMISQFQDEDDFLIDLQFDNQKGCFDLYIRY